MKNLFIIVAALFSLAACQSADQKTDGPRLTTEEKRKASTDTANYTSIEWTDSTIIDLGKVKKGAILEVSFPFKNVGNKPLVFISVDAGCGCTVPEKPERAYLPGEEGVIKAAFDTKNQHPGPTAKNVNVTSNTNPPAVTLLFKAEITE